MKTFIRIGLPLGSLLLGLVGCSEAPPPPPYRGEYMATLSLSPALEQALERKWGYKAANNCVQLVGRDKTKDGIRHVEPVVIFSPDACPEEEGKVADREAFFLNTTREPLVPSGMGGGLYPAIAYRLVLNAPNVHEEVGTVMLVDEIDTDIEEAPKMPVYQVGDVCTLQQDYEEMCGLIFTHDGRFNQIDSNRAAVGKRKREQRNLEGLKRYMDTMRNVLSSQLNDVQRNLITNTSDRLQALQNAIRNEQRMLAVQMVESLEIRLDELAEELNANQNANAKTVIDELRREMRALHAENVRILRAEIKAATSELRGLLNDVKAQLGNVETALIKKIEDSAKKLEANITGHQRRILLAQYTSLTADLDRLAVRIEGKVTDETTRGIRATRRIVRKYTDEVLKALREEVLCQATAFEHEVSNRFAEILGADKESLREKLLEEIRAIKASQTTSAALLAEKMPEIKTALENLNNDTGVAIDRSVDRIVARLEAALDEEVQAAEIVTRSVLGIQLAAVKKVWTERTVALGDPLSVSRFEGLLVALEKGGTPGEQLSRVEALRALVVHLAKLAGELDEAQAAAVHHVRITLRDYATTALRLEHRALVRDLLPIRPVAPRNADRMKRLVPEFAAAKFKDRARLALRLAESVDGDTSIANGDALVTRLEAYAKAVEAEQKLRDRVQDLR